MSIYTFPTDEIYAPLEFEMQMRGNVMVNRSPTNGAITTVEIPGDQWAIRMMYSYRANADYQAIAAFWNRFRGQSNILRIWNVAQPAPLGTLRGSPVLASAAVEGANSVVVQGSSGETILPGDMLGITLASTKVQLVQAAAVSGTGVAITVSLVAPLRGAANSSAVVVWNKPTADFILTEAPFIPYRAVASGGFSIEAVEFFG